MLGQVGVGAPPVTGVTGPSGGDGAATPEVSTTTVLAGPVPVVGAATTIPAVSVAAPVGGVTPAGPDLSAALPTVSPSITVAAPTSILAPSTLATSRLATSTKPPTKSGAMSVPPAVTADELRARIAAALSTSTSTSMGIAVAADGSTVLFERNADAPMIPASTQKIYIAGAALAMLGADSRFVTEVLATGPIDGALLRGDLVVRASGDPSLTSTNLNALASAVRSAGITTATGALVVDDGHFDRQTRVASWKPLFTPGESGWLSAFAVDGNHRNDAATIADPALANLGRFREALRVRGVSVVGASIRGATPAGAVSLASQRSAPLQDLVRTFVKKSDNTYAELVTKELGARQGAGSTSGGVAAIASYFNSLSVTPPTVQEDGSGLSNNNRSSARLQVRYLQRALASPTGVALRSSLAITCVDGTLKSRGCGTPVAGAVFAKSGSIDNVVALTGVTTTASGKAITFSFLLNNVRSARLGRASIDAALVAIVSSRI